MLDRSPRAALSWAIGCFALFALLTVGVVRDWGPIDTVDRLGEDAAAYADDHGLVRGLLRLIEVAFGFWGIVIMTLVLALTLVRRHPRAAGYVVGVVAVTTALRLALVQLIDRARPDWQLDLAFHPSPSFPSGHATTTTALCGVAAVVVTMLVRRRSVRRLYYTGLALIVALVALDRVLLGRHFVSDTVGGILFGAGVVLLGLALFDPRPRPMTRPRVEPQELDSAPRGRRLAVVLNPVKVESVGQFRSIVTEMARAAGWQDPDWFYTTVDDPGPGMARAAEATGADLVIVCGGDGTVREVCAALAGTGIAVGIIPAGTGNLLARNLSVPLYIRAAIDVALSGQDRAIDLVEVSGDAMEDTHFLVMGGMGFDAAIMGGVNEDIKKRIGWFAYVISAVKSLMFPAVRLEIAVDDEPPTKHRARTVVVGNVGYLQAGMPLLPDAAIDDGQIDLVVLYPKRFASWLPLAFRILRRGRHTDDLVNRITGRSFTIRANQETPRQLDGDPIGPGKELRMEVVPGRLLVRVPR